MDLSCISQIMQIPAVSRFADIGWYLLIFGIILLILSGSFKNHAKTEYQMAKLSSRTPILLVIITALLITGALTWLSFSVFPTTIEAPKVVGVFAGIFGVFCGCIGVFKFLSGE